MTEVIVFEAARMKEIEDGAIVSGEIVDGHLILTKHNGDTIDAGVVTSGGSDSSASGDTIDNLQIFNDVYGDDLGYDYEFLNPGSTLPSGWAWVNQSTRSYDESGGTGKILSPSLTNQWGGIVRDIPTESSFIATVKLNALGYNSICGGGIVLYESGSGKSVNYFVYSSGGGTNLPAVTSWANPTTQTSNLITLANVEPSPTVYLRVKKISSTSWTFEVSYDGLLWVTPDAARNISGAFTTAPDKIGIGSRHEASAGGGASCSWFRVR